jgi:NTP pyrophosphatase (non-canonical NTP hydrolase)
MKREQINKDCLSASLKCIEDKTKYRLNQKGWGMLASSHEALGIITEEYIELIEAIKNNDMLSVEKELLDIAVACHIAIACIVQMNFGGQNEKR